MTAGDRRVPIFYPTWFMQAADPARCCRRVKAAGFDGASFLAGTVADARRLDRLSDANAAALRDALAETGLGSSIHVWTDSFLEAGGARAAGELLTANVRACVRALCGPGLPPPTVTLDPPMDWSAEPPVPLRELAEDLVSFLADLSDEYGARGGVENWPYPSVGRPEGLAPLLKAGRGKVGVLLDAGHAHVAVSRGWCKERSLAEFVRALPAPIVEVHLHDNGGERDEHLMPGEGTADLKGLLDAALATGFAGPITVECDLSAPGRPGPADGLAGIRRAYDL